MYQALYRKWRPLTFADVIGQKHITDTLRSQMKAGRLSHAYIFTGTRGTGKTTCAKILARAINCENPNGGDPCNECESCRGILDGSILDVLEIDAASNNGVDNIRDIRDETRYTPAAVKKRVYIIDEVHMLSQGAFNALLKTLEEPPSHVLFILATTEIHKVPATILSRCQRFDFSRIAPEDIAERLLAVAQEESLPLTKGGAALIARLADGAMRDALSMLDRAAGEDGQIDEDSIADSIGILGGERAADLMRFIKEGALEQAVGLIGECYTAGRDLSAVLDQVLGLIRDMLLVKTARGDVSAMLSPAFSAKTVQSLAEGIAASTLIVYTRMIQESLTRMKSAANRRVEAELCIIRLCSLQSEDYDSLGGRVEALEEKIKNGVPVAVPGGSTQNTPMQDAPPWKEEKKAPAPVAQKPAAAKSAAAEAGQWPLWSKLLASLSGKISPPAHANLSLSGSAVLEGNTLKVLCDDEVTQMLVSQPATKDAIAAQASALIGQPCVVKVREKGKTPAGKETNDKLDSLLKNAEDWGIPVETTDI